MADFQADNYLNLTDASVSDGTLSWTITTNTTFPLTVVDVGDDGVMTQGSDFLAENDTYTFSGYTVSLNGNEYGILSNGFTYIIPYDSNFDDLTQVTGAPTSTSTVVAELSTSANCFLTGTLIATPSGEVAIEELQTGDMVLTSDGRAVPVRWLAHQTVANIRFLSSPKLEPVLISAGALGNGLPVADLTVSADHGMILDGLVINASALVNNTTIRFVPLAEMPARFTWWHIETEAHDEIVANGAAAESFIDYTGRKAFDNYAEYLELYGADKLIREMSVPRVSARRQLPVALRERLGIASATPDMAEIEHLLETRVA